MARRRFTFSRALALLILGIGLGATLFVARRLRPTALKDQVAGALAEILNDAAGHEFDDVRVGLDTGVEVIGLRIRYPEREGEEPQDPAVEVERLVLTVNHQDLLGGRVTIQRVDLYGLVLRLKAGPDQEGTPSMPGIFAGPGGDRPFQLPEALPEIRIYPGESGSRVEILDPEPLSLPDPEHRLVLDVRSAEAGPHGEGYRARAALRGERVRDVGVVLEFDGPNHRVDVDVDAKGLAWTRRDIDFLKPHVREMLPPVEMGGAADITAHATIQLPLKLASLNVAAKLSSIAGVFGNVHTGERVGLPFQIRDGGGVLKFDYDYGTEDGDGYVRDRATLALEKFQGIYVSPSAVHGSIAADLQLGFMETGVHLDLHLAGKGIEGSTKDLRHLLPPDIVESIVEKFLPAGTFDFDLTVSQRPSSEEKVVADCTMRDGRIDYAGRLDELTGKRFGFRYPVERCSGKFHIETHVPTARGLAEVIEIRGLHGSNPLARVREGGRKDVAVDAYGRAVIYDHPGGGDHEDIDITIKVRDLPIDAKLANAFASTPGGKPYEGFELSGWAPEVAIHIQRDGFREIEARAAYDVYLSDCSITYEGFPFPIRQVSGHIVSEDQRPGGLRDGGRILRLEKLRGVGPEGGVFAASGEVWQHDTGLELLSLRIEANRIVIGDDLERAILASPLAGTGLIDVWSTLRPYGRVTVTVNLTEKQNNVEVDVNLDELGLRGYRDIDCPITNLKGNITYRNGDIRLESVTGNIFDAPFHVGGTISRDGTFDVEGSVDRIVLQTAVQRILAAVAPPAADAIARLRLQEDSAFDVRLQCKRGDEQGPVELRFNLENLDVRSSILDFDLSIRGGPVTVDLDRITAENVFLRAKDGEVRLQEAVVPLDPALPAWGIVDARNLDPAEHLERLFGPGIREALGRNARIDLVGFRAEYLRSERLLTLNGGMNLTRHAVTEGVELEPMGFVGFSPLTLTLPEGEEPLEFQGVVDFRHFNANLPLSLRDLSGELRVGSGTLTPDLTIEGSIFNMSATLFDRQLTEGSLNLTYRPDYLHLGNIDGKAYGGVFEADAAVHLVEPRSFRTKFQARHVQIGELLKEDLPRSDPMTGSVEVRLEFESPSGEVEDMHGRGQVRVEKASLFRVPGLRPILGLLSRVTPLDNEPRFSRAEADFTVMGEEIRLHHCRLSTDLNDVDAEGSITIYGDLNLIIEPKVTRLIDLPRLINIPVLSTLRDLWHKIAYEIRLEGTLDSPTIRLRGLPFIRGTRRQFTQSPHAGRAERIRPHLLP